MDSIRIGVIGVGHLGSLHAKMIAGLPGVRLSGLYDIDAARAQAVAEEFGTKAAPDLDTLLQEADAVTIATSTSAHCAVAGRALEKGKHVFIEKPIAESVA